MSEVILPGVIAKAWAATQGKEIPLTLGIGGPRIGTVTAVSEGPNGEVIVAATLDQEDQS